MVFIKLAPPPSLHRNKEPVIQKPANSLLAVNNPLQWMNTEKPEIKVTNDDEEHLTDAATLHQRQLPPLKTKKPKKKPPEY